MSPLVTAVVAVLVVLAWGGSILAAVALARRSAAARARTGPGPAGSTAATDPADGSRGSRARQRLLDALEVGAVLLDDEDRVVVANAAARSLGACDAAQPARALVRAAATARRRAGEVQEDVALPRGRWRSDALSVRIRAAADADGSVALLVEDRTEARRLQAVRHDFVANVGHELKTPVGALRLLAEAVGDSADDPETVRRFAARAEREADRLGRLVTEMVDLSRLQGAEPLPVPTPVDLDAVVAEAVDRHVTLAAARCIRVSISGERGVVVSGDAAHLTTAVANLVDNAVTYSPEDTDVRVTVRRRDGRVEVAVSDQGVGIAEADRERVFERFFRADRARLRPDGSTGGSGLGLAIVKHVAENHGGTVDVWSVEGSGSTFTLVLPSADAPAALRSEPAPADGTAGATATTVPTPPTTPAVPSRGDR